MIPLLDTHQHLFYRDVAGYGWADGIPPLATGDFTLADYAGLVKGLGVGGTLFMETGVDDADYQAETRFVHGLMQAPGTGVKGIIASCRPEDDDGFDAWLDETLAMGVAGYRRILHVMPDELSQSDTFRRNLRKIGDAGKVFDLCFLSRQLPIAAELAAACANTRLVLNHCGVPDIAGGGLDPWRADMTALAALPNVTCKLSGLMAYCAPDAMTAEAIAPYVDHVLEVFGPDRMLWGGDWPVVDLAKGLPEWIAVTREILGKLSQAEATAIANGTAQSVYRVSLR